MQQSLLPLFPLSVVLLPGAALPLHIFEERYKEMIEEALASDTEFGVVQAREEGIVRTGCTARVDKVLKRYDDGRLDIMTIGQRRFAIDIVDSGRSFLRADVTFIEDDDPEPGSLPVRRRALKAFATWLTGGGEDVNLPDEDHPHLSFVLARVSSDLDFLQTLLGIQSEADRIQKVAEHLEQMATRRELHRAMQKVAAHNGHGPVSHNLGQ